MNEKPARKEEAKEKLQVLAAGGNGNANNGARAQNATNKEDTNRTPARPKDGEWVEIKSKKPDLTKWTL